MDGDDFNSLGDLDAKELGDLLFDETYDTPQNPLHLDDSVAQEPASMVPANEPGIMNSDYDLSEPENDTDPSTESRLRTMMNEFRTLVPPETQIASQEPILGVKETGKRNAEDVYDESSNKKLNTTTLLGISSNPPDSLMTQGFQAVPSIEGVRDQDSGGAGSSGNSQTRMTHIRQSQLRFIERQRLNRNPSHALEVPRDGPLRSGPNSAGGEVGRDQDSIGAGSSVLPLREFRNQSLQRFLERRASRINQNPIQVPDVPQPLYQGGPIQPQGGRGQGDLDLQGQFQQGRGPGDQNRGRGRGRGNQNRGRGRRNQNRGRRGDQNRGRGQ